MFSSLALHFSTTSASLVAKAVPKPTQLYAKAKFKNFEEMLTAFEEPILVDFYATWCGPCQLMSKELSAVGSELTGKVKVAKVDTDKYPNLGEKYEIEGLPTCILFKGGKPVHKIVGMLPADQIKESIAPYIA